MTKKRNTKRALLASVLSMMLCATMLIGSTFAWFTDNATTNVNTIQAGKLDIDLVDKDGETLVGQAVEFVDNNGDSLADNYLWEPGCRVLLQKVGLKNNGNLNAKYKVVISGITGDIDLAEVIDVYEGDSRLGTLRSFLNMTNGFKEGVIAPDETLYFGELKLVMQETADNDYQDKSISDIAISVYATQATVENDSYDNKYDEDAEYFTTAGADDKIGIEGGEITENLFFGSAFVDTTGTDKAVVVNGNGNTVKLDTEEVSYLTSANNSLVEMKDITITGEMGYLSVGNYVSGDAAQKAFNADLNNVTVKDVKVGNFNNEGAVAAVICYGTTELNNCDLSGTTTDTTQEAFDLMALNNSTVTVKGGYIEKAVVRTKGSMIVNGAKIDTIVTGSHGLNGVQGLVIEDDSEIGTISCRIYGGSNDGSLYKGNAKITIKAGATVETLDLTNVTVKDKVVIEAGATVNNVIVNGDSVNFETWKSEN